MCNYSKKCPCRGCDLAKTDFACDNCDRFRRWFLKAWKSFNRFAWYAMDLRGKREHFQYELPHEQPVMDKDPCLECPCRDWCDTPCSQRLKWWDIRMAELRHALGYRGCDNE